MIQRDVIELRVFFYGCHVLSASNKVKSLKSGVATGHVH